MHRNVSRTGGTSAPVFTHRTFTERPAVLPANPEAPGECLCGDPADFVIETRWFSGRFSRDPVCARHVAEIVGAITRKQAHRDGA